MNNRTLVHRTRAKPRYIYLSSRYTQRSLLAYSGIQNVNMRVRECAYDVLGVLTLTSHVVDSGDISAAPPVSVKSELLLWLCLPHCRRRRCRRSSSSPLSRSSSRFLFLLPPPPPSSRCARFVRAFVRVCVCVYFCECCICLSDRATSKTLN